LTDLNQSSNKEFKPEGSDQKSSDSAVLALGVYCPQVNMSYKVIENASIERLPTEGR
jgi:hypothetical protein